MTFRTVYGNTHSENGWRMCDRNECVLLDDLMYFNTAPIRAGWAFEALAAWSHWYDANVEGEIVSPVWGWSSVNDVSTSNHLSGTALDFNAPQYPWGGSTMKTRYPHRYKTIQDGLTMFSGIIYWGAWWGRKDEMHFQLDAGTAKGDGASQRLIDWCRNNVKNGYLNRGGSGTVIDLAPGAYPRGVVDGFAQLGRMGWAD